jgi:HIV Tat-specific factor 1
MRFSLARAFSSSNTSQEDPAAMLDIKEDIREECSKLGDVTNVVLFDKEPAGVASVRFSDAAAAEACVRVSASYLYGHIFATNSGTDFL